MAAETRVQETTADGVDGSSKLRVTLSPGVSMRWCEGVAKAGECEGVEAVNM